MGSYNSEYENYYNNLRRRNASAYRSKASSDKKTGLSFIERRIITELAGSLILFCILLCCKSIVTPATRAFYQYSKKMVSESYDYKSPLNRIKGLSISGIKSEGAFIKHDFENKLGFWISKLKMGNQN